MVLKVEYRFNAGYGIHAAGCAARHLDHRAPIKVRVMESFANYCVPWPRRGAIGDNITCGRALGFWPGYPGCVTKYWPSASAGCAGMMSSVTTLTLVELGTEELPPKALNGLGGMLQSHQRYREGPQGCRSSYAAPGAARYAPSAPPPAA